MMKFLDYLESKKTNLVVQLDQLFKKYKVQPVGNGYIDCIVMKDNLAEFIKEITSLGILITNVSWWCYVNPSNKELTACPHGMGGPTSDYYEGWFSELQNELFEVDQEKVNSILISNDLAAISSLNAALIDGIINMLKNPLRYTPTDYIEGNKCVMPGLWLLVPDDWDCQST
jgi:hypothetical protein